MAISLRLPSTRELSTSRMAYRRGNTARCCLSRGRVFRCKQLSVSVAGVRVGVSLLEHVRVDRTLLLMVRIATSILPRRASPSTSIQRQQRPYPQQLVGPKHRFRDSPACSRNSHITEIREHCARRRDRTWT